MEMDVASYYQGLQQSVSSCSTTSSLTESIRGTTEEEESIINSSHTLSECGKNNSLKSYVGRSRGHGRESSCHLTEKLLREHNIHIKNQYDAAVR